MNYKLQLFSHYELLHPPLFFLRITMVTVIHFIRPTKKHIMIVLDIKQFFTRLYSLQVVGRIPDKNILTYQSPKSTS